MSSITGAFSSKKQKSKSRTSAQRDTDEQTTQTGEREQRSTAEKQTSVLSAELQEMLSGLSKRFNDDILAGGTAQQIEAANLASLFSDRAQRAEIDTNKILAPIFAESRRAGEADLAALQTRLAQEAGGSMGNSFVTAATAEGRAMLESQLAAEEAKFSLQARDTQTQELMQALAGLQTDTTTGNVQNLSQLLTVLKGSTVEQKSKATTEEKSVAELSRIIKELTNSTTKGSSSGTAFSIGGEYIN